MVKVIYWHYYSVYLWDWLHFTMTKEMNGSWWPTGAPVCIYPMNDVLSWWRHQMETFYMLLALCVGNSLVTGEFPSQRPVTWSFDFFFDLCLNKWLSKQPWGWWFETPSRSWHHCHGCVLFGCLCDIRSCIVIHLPIFIRVTLLYARRLTMKVMGLIDHYHTTAKHYKM